MRRIAAPFVGLFLATVAAALQDARRDVADAYLKGEGLFREAMVQRNPRSAAFVVAEFLERKWSEEERPFVHPKDLDRPTLMEALRKWDAEAVVRACEAAMPDADAPGELSTGQTALVDLRSAALLSLFLDDMLAEYEAVVASGAVLEMPSLGKGRFTKKGDRTVFIGEDGREVGGDFNPLRDDDRAYLVLRHGTADASRHARIGFFYYYSAKGPVDKAFHHLERANALGARAIRVFLADPVAAARKERERALDVKLGAAGMYVSRRQWAPAKSLLDEILRFPDEPFTREHRDEIDRMLAEVMAGLREEGSFTDLYHGNVKDLEGGRVRVSYDFRDVRQMEAFELVTVEGQRRFEGTWKIAAGALESGEKTSVAGWKTSVRGDVVVEFDLTSLEKPQNIVVDLFARPGRGEHYAVVFGFDWVGKSEGDPEDTIEDRFAMPRTCVIRFPVEVDKARWEKPETWIAWKAGLVGGPAAAWGLKRGQPARISIRREVDDLRVLADGTVVWEGRDSAYREGQVVFFSDCRCRIDNLAIEFTP